MISPILVMAAALTAGLPIFALGERIRDRRERRLSSQHARPSERTFS